MKRMILILIFFLIGCGNKQQPLLKNHIISNNKKIYINILKAIKKDDLDMADDLYISLKNNNEKQDIVFDIANNLAIAHMAKKEYILANFYIQQMLEIDSTNEFARYLLNKNQFLAVKLNANNQKYIENAFKAMQTNVKLVSDSDYSLLVHSMLLRIKIENAWNNKTISMLYKRLNKQKAYKLYNQKIQMLNIDINSIYKPY